MKEDLKKIIEIAINAPSGENAQPWRFIIKGKEIKVINIPERDQSLYNHGQLGSYVSHGCLMENIVIAGTAMGFKTDVNILPQSEDCNTTAVIKFEKMSERKEEPLFKYIEKRCTNRKPYKKTPLTDLEIKRLKDAAMVIEDTQLILVQEEEEKKILGDVGSINEKVMFRNKFLHKFFFSHINWTKEEEEKKRIGFYIEAMEIPTPIKKIFKLFRYWGLINILNKVGFADKVAKENAYKYSSAAAMGLILTKGNAPKDMVLAGRQMQRVWLTATELGLSIQPLTGVLFFMQGILAGEKEKFSIEQIKLIEAGYKNIKNIVNIGNNTVAMMFRIGDGGTPTAQSMKLPAIITIQ